ncbi:MAG TPA: phosphoribosylglycinamide synthetase C domain-containing protein, partial [Streptosporangiaceae bacterium]
AGLLRAAAAGTLAGSAALRWAPGAAVTVVIAAEGYPERPAVGDLIEGADFPERDGASYLLHAGTARARDGRLVSAGGRVLNVVGTGPDLQAARAAAYQRAARVTMRGGWYRTDIAERAAAASL